MTDCATCLDEVWFSFVKHWIGLANLIKSSLCKHTAITFDDSATVVSLVESITTLGRTIVSGNTADEYHCDMKLDSTQKLEKHVIKKTEWSTTLTAGCIRQTHFTSCYLEFSTSAASANASFPGRPNLSWLTPSNRSKRHETRDEGTKKWLYAVLEGRRHLGLSRLPSLFNDCWVSAAKKAELVLIDAAAAQVADGFTLAKHRGSVTVVQLVLLGLFYEFTGQVEEEFLHVVGLFGRGLQVEHALGLGEVLSPLPENLPLLGQIYFITCRAESSRLSPRVRREGRKKSGTANKWWVRRAKAEVCKWALCMCGMDGGEDRLGAIYSRQ